MVAKMRFFDGDENFRTEFNERQNAIQELASRFFWTASGVILTPRKTVPGDDHRDESEAGEY